MENVIKYFTNLIPIKLNERIKWRRRIRIKGKMVKIILIKNLKMYYRD